MSERERLRGQEDRKRLKEKLKEALEVDRRRAARLARGPDVGAVGEGEGGRLLKSVFGIWPPDQRVGQHGSRRAERRGRGRASDRK